MSECSKAAFEVKLQSFFEPPRTRIPQFLLTSTGPATGVEPPNEKHFESNQFAASS